MQNVFKIIQAFGGMNELAENYIRIPGRSDTMMPLIIEAVGMGPRGMPQVSVCHTYTQNGDCMRDPEIVFEIGADPTNPDHWLPVMYQQDNLGMYQQVVFERDGQVFHNPGQVRSIASFAHTWDRNIGDQGYVQTAERIAAEKVQPRLDAYMNETPLGIALDDNPLAE